MAHHWWLKTGTHILGFGAKQTWISEKLWILSCVVHQNTMASLCFGFTHVQYKDKSIYLIVSIWETMWWPFVPNLSEITWLFIKMQPGQILRISRFDKQVWKIPKHLYFYTFIIISLMPLCGIQLYHTYYDLHCMEHSCGVYPHNQVWKAALTTISCIPLSTFSSLSIRCSWQGKLLVINTSPVFHACIICFLCVHHPILIHKAICLHEHIIYFHEHTICFHEYSICLCAHTIYFHVHTICLRAHAICFQVHTIIFSCMCHPALMHRPYIFYEQTIYFLCAHHLFIYAHTIFIPSVFWISALFFTHTLMLIHTTIYPCTQISA